MKNLIITLFISAMFCSQNAYSQITYISTFSGNLGGGVPLLGHRVPDGSTNMYLDWDLFGAATAGAGQGSISRAAIRATSINSDGETVVATDVLCYADGIYNGESGNNDVYYANLNVCNLPPGRYSIEIQADEPGEDYDNSTGAITAATSWNYTFPNAYYLGTAGACGESDPIDNLVELGSGGTCCSPQIEYFTVGDAGVFRSMLVVNGLFLDLEKFQPGNPDLPTSLNDLQTTYDPACVSVSSFPTAGFCSTDALAINGAEVNVFKYTSCGADVTGNRLFYRVYESGTAAPAYSNINIGFFDNCPAAMIGYASNFPTGGSCIGSNGIQDQRWQEASASIDVIALAPTAGTYVIEAYTETDIVDCSGTASTVSSPSSGSFMTTFVRLDDMSMACGFLPVELTSFRARALDKDALLTWETSSEMNSSHFEVERLKGDGEFEKIAIVEAAGNSAEILSYQFLDTEAGIGRNYYRLRIVDIDGTFEYSETREINFEGITRFTTYPTLTNSTITIEIATTLEQDALLQIYDLLGRKIKEETVPAKSHTQTIDVSDLSKGSYILVLRNGNLDYSTKFIKTEN